MKKVTLLGKNYVAEKVLNGDDYESVYELYELYFQEAVDAILKYGEEVPKDFDLSNIDERECSYTNGYAIYAFENLMGSFDYLLLKEV